MDLIVTKVLRCKNVHTRWYDAGAQNYTTSIARGKIHIPIISKAETNEFEGMSIFDKFSIRTIKTL